MRFTVCKIVGGIESATKHGIIDDQYSDELIPSMRSLVILNPSVILFNGVMTSSVSSTSPLATQPFNVPSFTAVNNSPLPILLLVLFLPLLSSQTLVQTNTLCLILQL